MAPLAVRRDCSCSFVLQASAWVGTIQVDEGSYWLVDVGIENDRQEAKRCKNQLEGAMNGFGRNMGLSKYCTKREREIDWTLRSYGCSRSAITKHFCRQARSASSHI